MAEHEERPYVEEPVAPANALILAGAVAKGAFAAGALQSLSEARVPIARVCGTSAGALNAAVYAAGIYTGRTTLAADVIAEMWLEHGTWLDMAHFGGSLLRGALDTQNVEALLLASILRVLEPSGDYVDGPLPPNRNVAFQFAATNLDGRIVGHPPETKYEQPLPFIGAAFEADGGLARITRAAAASSAFPGLFVPPIVDGHPCIDGGAVNNAPITYAIAARDVGTVIVVAPQPAMVPPPPRHEGGLAFVAHVAEILVSERLSRDLARAREINALIVRMTREMQENGFTGDQIRLVRTELGYRLIEVVEVRPSEALEGNAFSGFGDRRLREDYIAIGRAAGRAVLAARAGM